MCQLKFKLRILGVWGNGILQTDLEKSDFLKSDSIYFEFIFQTLTYWLINKPTCFT